MVEGLRNDCIRLAFIGESAEDKIGLINALLFSDMPGGLLPLGTGSEFLCATEIFHDPSELPYVRLLPIDTRKKQESIANLRRSPIEWITMRVNPDSPESIAETMRSLMESRAVSIDEAKSLNLTNVERSGDAVMIPAWRYALINMPHPMLNSGLIALYTPGPQILAAEPEVALRIASSAQSLLMVLGKELLPSSHDVWKQYVQNSPAHKFVVLDSGAGADAATAAGVAHALELPGDNVISLPIKQAVAARLAHEETADLMEGFSRLEKLHAEKLVPERQALLLSAVAKEIGPLVLSARQAVAARFIATVKEMQDLTSASGKNRSVAQDMLTRLENERKLYQKSVAAFNVIYSDLNAKGQELLATLHDDRIEDILSHDREFIQGAWTTAGMWKNMQGLFAYFATQVERILNYAGTASRVGRRHLQQLPRKFRPRQAEPAADYPAETPRRHARAGGERARVLPRPDQYRDLQGFPAQEVLRRPGRGSAPAVRTDEDRHRTLAARRAGPAQRADHGAADADAQTRREPAQPEGQPDLGAGTDQAARHAAPVAEKTGRAARPFARQSGP